MPYALLRTYALCHAIPRLPTREPHEAMRYKGLCLYRGMPYEGFNCTSALLIDACLSLLCSSLTRHGKLMRQDSASNDHRPHRFRRHLQRGNLRGTGVVGSLAPHPLSTHANSPRSSSLLILLQGVCPKMTVPYTSRRSGTT
jgi:hypothetical protein